MRSKVGTTLSAAAILAVVLSVATFAVCAAAQAADSNGESAEIVAHQPLSGHSVTQMFLQRQNGKQYLYVDQDGEQRVVIDVTKADRPSVVRHTAEPRGAAIGQFEPLSSDLAISEQPQGQAVAVSRRPARETVNVLDTTDPVHPQVLQTFSGVTSILPDADRNLIFIANADGLWVVRHRVKQGAYAGRHLCTSESALSSEPDCY
jgi:hypothetical protein